jgi:uncharacterized SAM-binding protein YcdF (DUF218 family)
LDIVVRQYFYIFVNLNLRIEPYMILLLKLCAIPLYPLGMCLVLLVAGIVLHFLKRRGAWPLLIAGTALLYCVSTPFFTGLITRPFEAPYYPAAELPRDCSAIVVLGGCGMPMVPPRTYPEISDAGDRLLHAARLFKMGIAPRVITSGGIVVGALHNIVTEGEHNAMLLREIGVDSAAIIIEKKSKVTADHGPTIGAILDSLRLPRKIILVTTATHMYRSIAVFKKNGFTVYPAATDFQASVYPVEGIRDFFPGSASLNNSTAIFHEVYGIIGYKVMGKI